MPNIEDKLKNIKLRGLDASERDLLWRAVVARKATQSSSLSFNFALKPMTALLIALAVLFSGTGVVAASDAAKPGDALFGIDLAVERVRMSLAGDDSRNELARTFAQERLQEIQKLRGDGSVDDDNASSTSSLSGLTEAEADVFTNETVVKIELNDRKFGFTTDSKTREAIVSEIAVRYNLDRLIVDAALVLGTEDRASRPEDRAFVNGQGRMSGEVLLDDDEKHDIQVSLDQVLSVLKDDDASSSAELRAALQGILESSAEGKIKYESDDQKVEFKFKDGTVEMKVKSEDNSGDKDEDRDAHDDDDLRVRLSGSASVDSSDDSDDQVASSSDEGRGGDDDSDEDRDDDSDGDRKSGSGSGHGDDDEDELEVDLKVKI